MTIETRNSIDPQELASLAPGAPADPFAHATLLELQPFDIVPPPPACGDRQAHTNDVEVHIELGRADLSADEALSLKEGVVLSLDKLTGDPVDILAAGRLVARGEVLVLNENLCVRIAEVFASSPPV